MRIIGYIPHTAYKVTVFKDGGRISVKFENGMYEQTYKFRDGSGVENLAEATAFVDADFLSEIEKIFTLMHVGKLQAYQRRQTAEDEDEFDVII